ncbi:hypothetical protein CBR_g23989 [Chara braunii]|uniref:Uncharacterized protein n=1 Tax=Chara braunii TaxID=69332 RepID=A0A388L5G5_CHABU|nr:hypothetical protein CBR_g23989 [Chara braunii]|eukprot:GBG77544.1 hypothetical protein CBR_g23989 [Chara braunii]
MWLATTLLTIADGSLYLATPVDVIFIALPILEVARMKKGDDAGKFRDLDDVLYVAGFPGYSRLKTLLEEQLELVCDVQEDKIQSRSSFTSISDNEAHLR